MWVIYAILVVTPFSRAYTHICFELPSYLLSLIGHFVLRLDLIRRKASSKSPRMWMIEDFQHFAQKTRLL
jgi:hypothetical protein